MGLIKTFPITTVVPNYEKLNFELATSTIKGAANAYQYGQKIFVEFDSIEELDTTDLTTLNFIVANHDGQLAEVTQTKVDRRELGIRELVQMAFYHPVLNNDETTLYLTSIDNYVNAFIRGGNFNALIAKIGFDAQDTLSAHHAFLNQIINLAGNKTYEFFISKIMTI